MYVTINIGNLRMTRELLKGNPRILMYVGCNGDSRVHTRVSMKIVAYANSHLEK